jgi:predicted transcriptional regulator
LLHLLENYQYRNKFIAPESLTQKGIQRIINCDLSVICRILKKNVENGFIYQKKMKIENVRQKKNAYFLTDNGFNLSEELRKKISDWD